MAWQNDAPGLLARFLALSESERQALTHEQARTLVPKDTVFLARWQALLRQGHPAAQCLEILFAVPEQSAAVKQTDATEAIITGQTLTELDRLRETD